MREARKRTRTISPATECIDTTAPARIDLAGGTVDIWPLYLFHYGAVTINAGINLLVRLRVSISSDGLFRVVNLTKSRRCSATTIDTMKHKKGFELFGYALEHFKPDTGLKIEYTTMVPEGAGLAGSSSLLVALCGALNRITETHYSKTRLLEVLRDIETRLIRVPAGLQDYYPALWGGVNEIQWDVGGGKRVPVEIPFQDLEQWLMLVYTKTSRYSGANNWNIVKRHMEGDRRIRGLIQKIVQVTHVMREALIKSDYPRVGEAMGQEATYRTQLLASIATPEIRHLEAVARSSGVLASKVCGAGGGGCVLLFLNPRRRELVKERLVQEGYEVVPFRIARIGLTLQRNAFSDQD